MLNRILLILAASLFFVGVATVSAEPAAIPGNQNQAQLTPEQQKQLQDAQKQVEQANAAATQATAAAQKAADEATKAATNAAEQANAAAQKAVDAAKSSQQSSQQIQTIRTQQDARARLNQPESRQAIKVTGKKAATNAAQENAEVAPSDRIQAK